MVHIAPQPLAVSRSQNRAGNSTEITQSIVEDDEEDDQQYYNATSGQILPIKSELDNDDGTVELIPSMDDKDAEMEEVVIPVNGDEDTTHQYIVSNEQSNSQQILTQGTFKNSRYIQKFFRYFSNLF